MQAFIHENDHFCGKHIFYEHLHNEVVKNILNQIEWWKTAQQNLQPQENMD